MLSGVERISYHGCAVGRPSAMDPRIPEGPCSAMQERIRVLLIEDDSEVTETIRDGLDASVFDLVHGGSLAEGRRLLARSEYHVVVLDINLPDGSGLELADEVRRAGSQVSILMLTGKAAVEERGAGAGPLVHPPRLRERILLTCSG